MLAYSENKKTAPTHSSDQKERKVAYGSSTKSPSAGITQIRFDGLLHNEDQKALSLLAPQLDRIMA